jgi:hypothetical protein
MDGPIVRQRTAPDAPRLAAAMTFVRRSVRMSVRRRITLTAVLVLISMGAAGLTTASDRPATDRSRPELTAHQDQLARPWLESMGSQADAVVGRVDAVNEAGRSVLRLLQGLDPAQINDALATGDKASSDLEVAVRTMSDERSHVPTGVVALRMSHANQQALAAIDAVLAAATGVPSTWQSLASDTRQVTTLLVALVGHDGLVFRATTAGRQEDWSGALDLLQQGSVSLAAARAVRDKLAKTNDVSTLDDLLNRYDAYDSALVALYTALRDGAAQDSQQVKDLSSAVDRAEAALPADTGALKVIVAEASESSIAGDVVTLEQARGTADEAVASLP